MKRTETDLIKIKEMTKIIARAVEPTDSGMCGILIHPFLLNSMVPMKDKFIDVTDLKNYRIWLKEFDKQIDSCDLPILYLQWRDPWKLTFMKFCGPYLSEKDYAEYLADAWVAEENPNMDANVSTKEAIKMFRSCKPEYLMTEADYEYYKRLPQEVTLYRGVSKGRVRLGLSWTDSKEKAEWFRDRWKHEDNCLLQVTVDKKDIIAYFNTRQESECLLDVFKYEDKIQYI